MKQFFRFQAVFLTLVCGVLVLDPAAVSSAESGPDPRRILLGTATPGGGFELFGRHLADVVNGIEPSLQLETVATRGSLENLSLLESGRIDIGLVEGNAAHQALEGVGRAPADLKVLSVIYPNPGMFAVRADSPYRKLEDLGGKPVAFGTRDSGLRLLARDVLDGIGLVPERDFEQVILAFDSGAEHRLKAEDPNTCGVSRPPPAILLGLLPPVSPARPASAPASPEESVRDTTALVDRFNPRDDRRIFRYDGTGLPWGRALRPVAFRLLRP